MPSRRVPHETTPNRWSLALAARRASGARLVDLTQSNPTLVGLSPLAEAAAALARVAAEPYDPSARGAASARGAVAAVLGGAPRGIDECDVVLTSSTSEAYAHLFRLLADPGEFVLAPSPGYPLFEPLARAEGIRVRTYRLAFDGAWHLDRDSLLRAMRPDARAVIVVEPNHPTGSCLDPADREFLESQAELHGLALIADEVFGASGRDPARGALPGWLGERRVPTFVLGGLSKLCGLPQHKLAWIVGAGPTGARREALAGLEWLADLFLSVGSPVQAALTELLALRHAFAARVRERVAANLGAIEHAAGREPALAALPAHGGWSAVLRLPATRTDEEWALALLERGVAVHPGHFYDFGGGTFVVVSVIAPRAEFEAGIAELEALVAGR